MWRSYLCSSRMTMTPLPVYASTKCTLTCSICWRTQAYCRFGSCWRWEDCTRISWRSRLRRFTVLGSTSSYVARDRYAPSKWILTTIAFRMCWPCPRNTMGPSLTVVCRKLWWKRIAVVRQTRRTVGKNKATNNQSTTATDSNKHSRNATASSCSASRKHNSTKSS